jgi:mono/diheme cytochrome c family protein
MRGAILLAVMTLSAAPATGPAPSHRPSGQGDLSSGRAAFIVSGCAECHTVSGDPDLPAHAPHGTLLRELSTLSATEISARITARSPSGSKWMEAAESGMSRSTGCTTRQDVRSISVYLQANAR